MGVSVSAGGGSLSEIKPYEPLIHSFLVAVARAGRCQCVSWKVLVQYTVMNSGDLRDLAAAGYQDRRTPPSSPSPCGVKVSAGGLVLSSAKTVHHWPATTRELHLYRHNLRAGHGRQSRS